MQIKKQLIAQSSVSVCVVRATQQCSNASLLTAIFVFYCHLRLNIDLQLRLIRFCIKGAPCMQLVRFHSLLDLNACLNKLPKYATLSSPVDPSFSLPFALSLTLSLSSFSPSLHPNFFHPTSIATSSRTLSSSVIFLFPSPFRSLFLFLFLFIFITLFVMLSFLFLFYLIYLSAFHFLFQNPNPNVFQILNTNTKK